jgi:hypothetical protein
MKLYKNMNLPAMFVYRTAYCGGRMCAFMKNFTESIQREKYKMMTIISILLKDGGYNAQESIFLSSTTYRLTMGSYQPPGYRCHFGGDKAAEA